MLFFLLFNQADPSGAYRLLQQDDMNQPNGHLFDEQDSADDDSADSGLEANEVETHEAGACAIGYTVDEPTLAINYSVGVPLMSLLLPFCIQSVN